MLRVEAILRDVRYQDYMAQNAASEQERRFCRHNFQHLLDVARITYILMLEDGAVQNFADQNKLDLTTAKELIYASALLHDIGRWKEYETGKDHAQISAELAIDLMKDNGFNEKEVKLVCAGISEHRALSPEPSLLGRYLFRADDLSRICAQCQAREDCYKIGRMETGKRFLIY